MLYQVFTAQLFTLPYEEAVAWVGSAVQPWLGCLKTVPADTVALAKGSK